MRIQHNIPAMNSLSKYTTNNNALAKNLEKLSSGFRINSAADDAAGLAVSEKMRAQIAGLEQAYNNTNDGISLVQTAEGALTEVNTMLTRLKTLATESSNGTYQNDVDRENIQNEVDDILSEIDRISDSTNFNGIKLLDGSLGGGGSNSTISGNMVILKASGKGVIDAAGTAAKAKAKSVTGSDFADINIKDNSEVSVKIQFSDGSEKDLKFTFDGDTQGGSAAKVLYNGEELSGVVNGANGKFDGANIAKAIEAALKKDESLSSKYNIDGTTGAKKLSIEAKEESFDSAYMTGLTVVSPDGTVANPALTITAGKSDSKSIDVTALGKFNGTTTGAGSLSDSVITVGGEKFVVVDKTNPEKALDLPDDVHYVIEGNAAADTAKILAEKINHVLGANVAINGTTSTQIDLVYDKNSATGSGSNGGGKGLVLQVGDTNDDFQQVSVSIADMGSEGLGINGLDLKTQDSALAALKTINDAVNTVSAQRGKLGALQNRLEHAMNNLDTMTTNISSSESQIRDVNMAKEMTAYTKNNILAQAAQSMLAQANSMPQGVLQLLQ